MADSTGYSRVEVRILGREMVMPAAMRRESFFLSCLDLMWQTTRYNQRLIFYESSTVAVEDGQNEDGVGQGTCSVMEKLKSSLARCLLHYFPWCGRIAKGEPPACRLSIDFTEPGVEFLEACINLPLSQIAKDGFQVKPFFEELCQHPDHTGDCLYSSPLLSVQATLFLDGGLALGIAQSHLVADGQSLWNFLVSWGECSRGAPLSMPPLHNRELLSVPDPSSEKATWTLKLEIKEEDLAEKVISSDKSYNEAAGPIYNGKGSNADASPSTKDDDVRAGAGSIYNGKGSNVEASPSTKDDDVRVSSTKALSGGDKPDPKPDPLVQCVFHLSSSAVKKLKAEAGEICTSFEVTCAHIWKRVAIARAYPMCEPTYFYLPVNCRTRITTPIPPGYFGNVVVFDVIVSTVGAICREPLSDTARRIHDAVANMKEDYLESFMHWMETHNNSMMGARSHARPIGKGHNVASSPWFPAYQVDFGWGKPVAVRTVKIHGDGELVLFGGRPGSAKGDVEFCTALCDSILRRLLRDPVFLAKPPSSPLYE